MLKRLSMMLSFGIMTLLCTANVVAQGPDTLWTRTYGGADHDLGSSVQQASDGGYVIAGWTVSYGAGRGDVYLIKTGGDGHILWTKTYGDTMGDAGHSVTETGDGGYLTVGHTYSEGPGNADVYLIRSGANGDMQWAKTYGGALSDFAYSVLETSDHGALIAGYTESFGVGGRDVYLLRVDAEGDSIWARAYGGSNHDVGSCVSSTEDGCYLIAGYTYSFGSGSNDAHLLKVEPNGTVRWAKTYGGAGSDGAHSVHPTSDGGCVIAGYTGSFGAGSYDVYLIKTDPNGDTMWTRTYGGSYSDGGLSVEETVDGGYIVVGWTTSFGAGNGDAYILRTDAHGEVLWTRTYGGREFEEAYSVQLTSDGGYIVAGYTFSFGAGGSDVWLIRIGPDVGIQEEKPPYEYCCIYEIVPNPCWNRTVVQYSLREDSNVNLTILNLLGEQIKMLIDDQRTAGLHTVVWKATDDTGRKVPSGTYFLRLQAHTGPGTGNYTATRKVCVVR